MILFAKLLLLQPLREASKNNSTKTFRNFKKHMVQFLLFLHAKTVACLAYSRNLKFYGEGLQQRSYSSKVVKYIKIYPESIWERLQNYINWDNIGDFIDKFENFFICWHNFGNHPRITSHNLGNFQEKWVRWSSAIAKPKSLRFTLVLLMFLRFMILWNLIVIYETLLLILVSSQSYLGIKSIANLVSISIGYGVIIFFQKSKY